MTPQQRKALHKYCELLAEAMNFAGFDQKKTFEFRETEIPWEKMTVKKSLFKQMAEGMYPDITSTEDLDPSQVSNVYESLNRWTASKLGISVAWPNREEE